MHDDVEYKRLSKPRNWILKNERELKENEAARPVELKEYNDKGAVFYKDCLPGVAFIPET